ncbi:MAG: MFS transporter [Chloroflexi bacterium]|nr:MFS transporter [Ardenticatenaceae bacterium]NOG33780.1 MFS transporter [Chloroflexota bacterium]
MEQKTTTENVKSLRPFFTLWGGQAVSLFGSQIVQFALIWWLTKATGSATILAAASLVGLLPQVLLGPFAGVLVDRWPRRWVMFVADSLVALASLVLAYLFWSGAVEIWHVFALLFVRALGGAFHWPAMQASTPLMVPAEQLTRIQGLNQMLQGGMSIVAAPLGALLVSVLTMPALLAIDVVTALFAIVPLLFIAVPQPKKAEATGSATLSAGATAAGVMGKTSFWTEMRLGFHYILSWPAVLMLMGMAMFINFLLTPLAALQPLLITQHFQGEAIHLGVLEAAFGLGIVAGGILLGVWGGFQKRIYTSLVGLVGLGIGIFLLGLAPANMFWLAVGSALLAGSMISLTNGPIMAIFQAVVDPAMQGRVFTLLNSAAMAMSPLSLIVAGPFADAFGVRTWFMMGGVLTLVVALTGFVNRPLLGIENGRTPAEPPVVIESDTAVPLVTAVQPE